MYEVEWRWNLNDAVRMSKVGMGWYDLTRDQGNNRDMKGRSMEVGIKGKIERKIWNCKI